MAKQALVQTSLVFMFTPEIRSKLEPPIVTDPPALRVDKYILECRIACSHYY